MFLKKETLLLHFAVILLPEICATISLLYSHLVVYNSKSATVLDIRCVEKKATSQYLLDFTAKSSQNFNPPISMLSLCNQGHLSAFGIPPQTTSNRRSRGPLNGKILNFPKILDTSSKDCRQYTPCYKSSCRKKSNHSKARSYGQSTYHVCHPNRLTCLQISSAATNLHSREKPATPWSIVQQRKA